MFVFLRNSNFFTPLKNDQHLLLCIYRSLNKQEQKEYFKDYRVKNREHINEKIQCQCGSFVARINISRHQKTIKHFELLKLVV